ncbi:MAG: hypothetical protein ACRDOI_43120 [Trebonia sp.]
MRRLLAAATLPVVLAAALVGLTGVRHAASAAPQAVQGCILGIICLPDPPSPTPAPGPSASSATATPAAPSSAKPAAPGSPSVSPSAQSSAPAAGPSGSAPAGASPSPSASPSPTAGTAAGTPGLVAAAATAVLTAGTANISGFHYVGNVNVPIAGGTEPMMKFTADSIDLSGTVTVTVVQNGTTVTTVSATQDFSDGVTLYATRLSGALQAAPGLPGVPLNFTPGAIGVSLLTLPNAGLLQLANLVTGAIPLTLTGVTTDQLLISSGTQVTTQLSMS